MFKCSSFMSWLRKSEYMLLSVAVIILFHFLSYDRFGFYVDEIGSMYDAYCISNFGVDRWLQSYPIHFLNYGDGQSAIFVYILSVLFKLFGYSKEVIRFVPLVMHIVTIIFLGKIIGLYNKKLEKYSYICLYTLPVFYLLFQFGLESHFMLTFSSVFMYFLLKAVSESNNLYFILSGLFVGLTFYTYALSYIFIPIFIIIYVIYLFFTKKVCVKSIVLFSIPVAILGIPLFIVQVINIFDLSQFVVCGITFPRFLVFRSGELGFSNFFSNLYNAFINTNFYESTAHLCIPVFGNIYYMSIPFAVLGAISHIRKFKSSHVSASLVIWTICAYILAGLLQKEGALTNTRLNAIYLSKSLFIIEGLWVFICSVKKFKKCISICIVLAYSISFLSFMQYYFTRYDLNTQSNLFMETYEDLPELNGTIYLPDNYVYFLWSLKVDPYDFDINSNGYLSHKNYRLGYQSVNTESYYVISKNDVVSQETLNGLGFSREYEIQHFYIYSYKFKD